MLFSVLLTIIAGILAVPGILLLLEILASLPTVPDRLAASHGVGAAASATIVVPAHNESGGILPTLHDLRAQLSPLDRLLVVADNCSDNTAEIAAATGAEVIERNDLSRIGKGYALAFAVSHLEQSPPDMVLFVDADCRTQADTLQRLKDACSYTSRPVQACFLMTAPQRVTADHRLAEFFWLIRNWVRPLGLAKFGLPVQMMGTGMMFPWSLIRELRMDGNLVEDMKLGLDSAAAGYAPCFQPSVVVTSEFPETKVGSETQRQRWIQGQLQMVFRELPHYFLQALRARNLGLLVLALDLTVPPFSMLLPFAAALLLIAVATFALSGATTPLLLTLADCLAIGAALGLAWGRYGRRLLPSREIRGVVSALVGKASQYGRIYFGRKASSWIRTDRSKLDV